MEEVRSKRCMGWVSAIADLNSRELILCLYTSSFFPFTSYLISQTKDGFWKVSRHNQTICQQKKPPPIAREAAFKITYVD